MEKRKKERKNLPPFFLHAIAALEPLVLAFGKVGVPEDTVPFGDHVLAGELPVVPEEPKDLSRLVVLVNHLVD